MSMSVYRIAIVLLTAGLLLAVGLVVTAEPQDAKSRLPEPAGVDLDVTYISREPRYHRYEVLYTVEGKPYLRPGTEGDRRWPAPGETVTFTAHFANKGTVAGDPFNFVWRVDGADVLSGTHAGLAPDEAGTATFAWIWDHTLDGERLLGSHTIAFVVDPADALPETYESNNVVEDRTDALSLVLAVTPDLYAALETPVDPRWPFSAEDWLQKQIAALNAAFARSVYPAAPQGVVERVRLDEILVTGSAPPVDPTRDGAFFMQQDDRVGNPYYHPDSDVSGALLHELAHQLGIIDLYNLDVALETPQVRDAAGKPVQMEYRPRFVGLMNNAGIDPPFFAEHTALALNANAGYRRGYYGEYLYDVPLTTTVRVLDNRGQPAPDVTLRFYKRTGGPAMLGGRHGVIDDAAEFTVTTDLSGAAALPNLDVGEVVTTPTGHALRDNPFGLISVVGKNEEFLVEVRTAAHEEYLWLDITAFNLAAWRGAETLTLTTHAPPAAAPPPPVLTGTQAYGEVALTWSAVPSTVAYHLYRTSGPSYAWRRVVTGTTALTHDLTYDMSARAAGYAVTAVDGEGRESGFGNLFWALRLQNPYDLVLTEGGERLVLDSQNGYALLLQTEEGDFYDTLGSFDLHLEDSRYLARDPLGRLLLSHPGDAYSPRHSVRVLDGRGNLLAEWGERGTGPLQFDRPAGLTVWDGFDGASSARVLVADSGNDRLQALTLAGDFVSAYRGTFDDPQGLAVLPSGEIVVADRGNSRLQLLDFDGSNFTSTEVITGIFNAPSHVAVHGRDHLIVSDPAEGTVIVLDRAGGSHTEHGTPDPPYGGTLNQPHGVVVDRFGRILVADTGHRRVVPISGALPALPPTSLSVEGPAVGEDGVSYTFTASVTPPTATLPLTYTWRATGHSPITHTLAAYTDAVAFSWGVTGTYTVSVTAANGGGSAAASHRIVVNPEFRAYLPLILRAYPPGPQILTFHADVEIADPGQTILLQWETYGGTGATLYHLLPTGQFGSFWSVDPTGSMAYTISSDRRNSDGFQLYVYDDEGRSDSATLNLPLTCPDSWFFTPAPDICPAGPAVYTGGAEQHFEQGVMLWVEAEDRIYVLYDDGGVTAWQAFQDEWEPGDPIEDPGIDPPPGYYEPIRGFGLVWREQPNVRERLGWATEPEQGYTTAIQRTSHWKYSHTYIQAHDGGTWRLGPEGGEWEYIP